jgi:NAD(P)H-hydrate epimerase
MARLLTSLDCKPGESRVETAQTVARLVSAVVLLKGHQTVIGDGNRAYLNSTGNPGMATGGSGDVLTGIIAALWCQGLGGFEAACLGAWVHGRAGDLLARTLGQISLVATDLIDGLPGAFARVVE